MDSSNGAGDHDSSDDDACSLSTTENSDMDGSDMDGSDMDCDSSASSTTSSFDSNSAGDHDSSDDDTCSLSTNSESSESSSKLNSDTSSDSSEAEHTTTDQEVINSIIPGLSSEYFTPLYDSADITVIDSYLMLFQYSLRHSLTKKAFSELIQLVSVHLPCSSKSAESLYKLKGLFMKSYEDIKQVPCQYCSKCHRLLESALCPSGCSSGMEEFLHIPLQPQLKRKIEDPHIWKLLEQRFSNRDDKVIRDIYDGREYQKHSPLLCNSSNRANVSFLCNTDGVAIFKSSKGSLWPIWIVINELPPMERFSKQNMMLAGLWHAKVKPTMTTYLMPLVKSMNDLYEKGISVSTPDGLMTAKAVLILCSVDLPAQAPMRNAKQYNGAYGCAYCEAQGTPRPTSHMHRNWPTKYPGSSLRTHQSILDAAREAVASNNPVKGIKGACVFCLHKPFDLAKGFAIDDLHVIFLGTVSDLLEKWFGKKYRANPYSIRLQIDVCDKLLLSIRVPDIISRVPKSLHESTKWKGSQLRSWVLFYSLPVLFGVLPQVYFNHFAQFVSALHILLSDAITTADLKNTELYLKMFYEQYPQLYGENSATMKVHLLSHITECVKNWGPLWAYSCFSFEGHNHVLKTLFHGTRQMNKQLAFSHTMLQVIPILVTLRSVHNKDQVQIMLETLTGKKRLAQRQLLGQENCYVLGKVSTVTLSSSHIDILNTELERFHKPPICSSDEVHKFYRVVVGKNVFFSKEYTRVKARNSFTVEYIHQGTVRIGTVLYFIYISGCTFASISELQKISNISGYFGVSTQCLSVLHCSGVIPVVPVQDSIEFVPVNKLYKKAVFIQCGVNMYVGTFPSSVIDD